MATPKQVASGSVEASNLRSMSETRKAKFKRLLEQQVPCNSVLSALDTQCQDQVWRIDNGVHHAHQYSWRLRSQGVITHGRF